MFQINNKHKFIRYVATFTLLTLILACDVMRLLGDQSRPGQPLDSRELIQTELKPLLVKMFKRMHLKLMEPVVALNISDPSSYINTHTKPFLIELVKNATSNRPGTRDSDHLVDRPGSLVHGD